MRKLFFALFAYSLLQVPVALAAGPGNVTDEQLAVDAFRAKVDMREMEKTFHPSIGEGGDGHATRALMNALVHLNKNAGALMNEGAALINLEATLRTVADHPLGASLLKDMVRYGTPIEQRVEAILALRPIGSHPVVAEAFDAYFSEPPIHPEVIQAIADVLRARGSAQLRGIVRKLADQAIGGSKMQLGSIAAIGGVEAQEALFYILLNVTPSQVEVEQVYRTLRELKDPLDPDLLHRAYQTWRQKHVPQGDKTYSDNQVERIFQSLALKAGDRVHLDDLLDTFERAEGEIDIQREVLAKLAVRSSKEWHLIETFVAEELAKPYVLNGPLAADLVRVFKSVRPNAGTTRELLRDMALDGRANGISAAVQAEAIDFLLSTKSYQDDPTLLTRVARDPQLRADEVVDLFSRRMAEEVDQGVEIRRHEPRYNFPATWLWSQLLRHPNREVREKALEAARGRLADDQVWATLERAMRSGEVGTIKDVRFKSGFVLPTLSYDFTLTPMFVSDAAAFGHAMRSDVRALRTAIRRGEIKTLAEESQFRKELGLLPESVRAEVVLSLEAGKTLRASIDGAAKK